MKSYELISVSSNFRVHPGWLVEMSDGDVSYRFYTTNARAIMLAHSESEEQRKNGINILSLELESLIKMVRYESRKPD